MASGQTPAGWYPDPAGDTSKLRYWDGQAWTEQTQQRVSPEQLSSIATTPIAPEPVYAPGQTIPVYAPVQPVKDRKGFAIAGLVLGIVSVVFCCLSWVDAIVSIIAIVFSVLGLKSSKNKMAIAGVILGAVGLLLAIVFLFVALDILNDPTKYGLSSSDLRGLGY